MDEAVEVGVGKLVGLLSLERVSIDIPSVVKD